jgi:hypothetical protein
MPFTAQELSNISNAALDFYIRGEVFQQSIQEKPLLAAMMGKQKTFPGGKGNISIGVQGAYDTSAFAGYTHNDTVAYTNPANIKRAVVPWKEVHNGITLTLTELKIDGISVVDSATSKNTTEHSDREETALADLLENKLFDMGEAWAIKFNDTLWRDGTQDSKLFAGIMYFVADDPTTGVVAGIDRSIAANAWWRNRSAVGASAITHSAANQTLTKFLRKEVRQLRRYGGKPSLVLCGSAFLEDLEDEVQEKGTYTQTGFVNKGKNDIGMAVISMQGVGDFMYDPTLDDLGQSDRCYFLDMQNLRQYVMEGEDRKTHSPARPYDQYTLYRGVTWTGAMCAKQLNGCGVYESI